MPREDGYTLIRYMREHESAKGWPATPAIALSAYARGEDRSRAVDAGYQIHVPKPVDPAALVLTIGNLLVAPRARMSNDDPASPAAHDPAA